MKLFKLIVLAITLSAFGYATDFLTLIETRLAEYHQNRQLEKVYIHTDKLQYTSGDTIWLKTYLVAAQDHRTAASRVVYVTLKNKRDSLVAQRKLYIEQGGATADIALPASLAADNYQLAAYTNHQLNDAPEYIFRRTIPIFYQTADQRDTNVNLPLNRDLNTLDDVTKIRPEVQFFPEGGDLVNGVASVVGWKIIDTETGQELSASGYIEDNTGKTVSALQTYQFGMGRFTIKPKKGKQYQAVIKIGDTEQIYPLPAAQPTGEVLTVKHSPEKVSIKGVSNRQTGFLDYSLVVHTRGKYLAGYTVPAPNKVIQLDLPNQDLPAGLLQITLFDNQQRPVAERLIFIVPDHVQPTIKLAKNTFAQREKVNLKLDWQPELHPQWNSVSLTVVNKNAQLLAPQTDNIQSWLLLNSDIGGALKNAAYYFENIADNKRQQLLDLVLLTHGWRRFTWKDILNATTDYTADYAIEEGLFLDGKTTYEFRDKTPVAANVFVSFLPSMLTEEFTSAVDGTFSYGPFIAEDTISIIVQARIERKQKHNSKKAVQKGMLDGKRNVKVKLSPRLSIPQPQLPIITESPFDNSQKQALQSYLTTNQNAKIADKNYDLRVIDLEGAEVTADRIISTQLDKINASAPFPSNRMLLDSLNTPVTAFRSVFDLFRRVAGVIVHGSFPNYSTTIRGTSSINSGSTPLYLLDGFPITEEYANVIPIETVYNVDIYKGASAAFYGFRGSNGVIAIYTRTADTPLSFVTEKAGVTSMKFPAFYRARQFYQMKHNEALKNPKPDFRTTLHWQPNITLSPDSTVLIDFFTGDDRADYKVILEGVDSEGHIYRAVETFKVE